MRQIVRVFVGLLLLAVLLGCMSKRTRSGAVSGKITYKGQPVNDAALLLYPSSGGPEANPITMSADGEGNFRITDVPPGEYTIVVEGSEGVDNEAPLLKMLPPDKQAEMKAKMAPQASPKTIPFPKRYKDRKMTDLKCTITDKDQPMDLVLKD